MLARLLPIRKHCLSSSALIVPKLPTSRSIRSCARLSDKASYSTNRISRADDRSRDPTGQCTHLWRRYFALMHSARAPLQNEAGLIVAAGVVELRHELERAISGLN